MVFIVTALNIEAAPIIQHFKLKKDMNITFYQIYKNDNIVLIVSGVGKIKSAMAAAYLFSTYKSNEKPILINIGFCGTNSSKYEVGSMLLINKITDIDTGYDYYPDIFIDSSFPREALYCYSRPVESENFKVGKDIFCDMESSGIMEAASKFTYAHKVAIIKIISDYLSPNNLDRELLDSYIRNNIVYIEQIIGEMNSIGSENNEFSIEEEVNFLNIISENIKLTKSMEQIFWKEVKKAKIKKKNR